MDLYEIQPLDIPEFLIEIIKSKKTLNDLTKEEFENILRLPLFETFIQNSMYSNEIYKNEYDLFIKLYIHKELINDFITIWQQILDEKDDTDYIFNNKITIKSNNFIKVKSQIENIIIANSINFLKQRVSSFIKAYINEDLHLEALNLAVATLISKLKDFDVTKGFDLKSYIGLFIDSAIKNILNDEKNLIKYPKEFYLLKKVIDDIKEEYDDFFNLGYKEILIDLISDIKNKDIKLIQKVGENYFYILGYGEVTQNEFIKKYLPKNFDIKLLFSNVENTKIFQTNLLSFIKEKEESKKTAKELGFTSKIVKLSEDLNSINMGFDSLDREIGEEGDGISLGDLIEETGYSNYDAEVNVKLNLDIFDREIRLTKTPNVNFTLLERIIAGTCIDLYFTFKEFTILLLEYGKEKGVGDKYVKNFHLYLSIFGFKDKSNWEQYDERKLDALEYIQMGDILDFSEEYARKVWENIEKKFNDYYENFGIVFQRYDPRQKGEKIRSFKDLGKPRTIEEKLEYVPPENFADSYQALRKNI